MIKDTNNSAEKKLARQGERAMAKAPTGYTLVDDGLGRTFKIKNSNFDSFGRPKNPMLIINLVKMRDGRRWAKRNAEKVRERTMNKQTRTTATTSFKINRSEMGVLVKKTGGEDSEAKVTITTQGVEITFLVSRAWARVGGEGWAINGSAAPTVKTRKEVVWDAIQGFNAGRLPISLDRD